MVLQVVICCPTRACDIPSAAERRIHIRTVGEPGYVAIRTNIAHTWISPGDSHLVNNATLIEVVISLDAARDLEEAEIATPGQRRSCRA